MVFRKKNSCTECMQLIKMYIVLQYIENIKASIFLNKEPNYRSEKCCIEINLKSVDTMLVLHKSLFSKLKILTDILIKIFPRVELMRFSFDCKNYHGTKAF